MSGDGVELFAASVESHAVTEMSAATVGDDSRFVEAARRGDRAAFGHLYDRYARMVHGILLARVPVSEVDDLVQDVFLLALPRLHTLRDNARFGAWLAAITRNRAHDFHRQSVEEVELPDDLPQTVGAVQRPGVLQPETASILEAIRSLPQTYSETLMLRLVEGMTGPEIAQRTGLTPGSVRVNLHRGMQQLREKLAVRSREAPPESV